jgi:hypothetical protein
MPFQVLTQPYVVGSCILYLFDQRILSRLVSEIPASGKVLAVHNTLIVLFLTSCASPRNILFSYPDIALATILSYVSISKPIPKYIPATFTLIACLMPLPLIIYFITRPESPTTVQLRVWVTLALVQFFGSVSSCFFMMSGGAFALVYAVFLALWMSGMMFVFQSKP